MRKYIVILFIGNLFFFQGLQQACAQVPPKPRDTTIQGPQTFAIILGISKYKYVRPLTYADKDAEMFRDYLKSPAGQKDLNGSTQKDFKKGINFLFISPAMAMLLMKTSFFISLTIVTLPAIKIITWQEVTSSCLT